MTRAEAKAFLKRNPRIKLEDFDFSILDTLYLLDLADNEEDARVNVVTVYRSLNAGHGEEK